jgi:hypothetical protein
MYIPAFIEDDEIVDKLNEKGIRVVSPVYRRVIPGTQVADGTLYELESLTTANTEFNPVISSTAFTTEIALILSVDI